jgi:hypothetical protein
MDILSWISYHSMTKVSSVTSRSSLMITFLVVVLDELNPEVLLSMLNSYINKH